MKEETFIFFNFFLFVFVCLFLRNHMLIFLLFSMLYCPLPFLQKDGLSPAALPENCSVLCYLTSVSASENLSEAHMAGRCVGKRSKVNVQKG